MGDLDARKRASTRAKRKHLGLSDSESPAAQDLRGRHMGRYLVLGVLGRGGMGVVVEAHDAALDRSVALKLLNASAMRRGQLRLLREAQALARLSHPNVVQIYDIGELDEQTFIAMELVRGRTLRAWGRERQPWRSAVAVYLQAARGLSAAHLKGLVHRDFKPENCIIDEDGRVRVLDFGLAREIAPASASLPDDSDPETEPEPSGHVLGESLTRPGVLMGTLGYMSFEQLQGRSADAYSDQFALCVSLYEAIFGAAPYPGHSASSLFSAMYTGTRQPPPAGVVIPRRLSRALWRGLATDPAARWPSMQALITELEALSSARRSRVVVGALAASLASMGSLALMRKAPDPCPDIATALAGTWDAEARERVAQVFTNHAIPDGAEVVPRLVDRLDGYATAWAEMTRESCEATFVVRRQSEAQLEQRTRCLERRRNRFVATITALTDAENAEQLAQAVALPFRLPSLEPCTEATREELDAAPIEAPTDEGHAEVRRIIDEASTLREAGRIPKATALAESALASARELGDPRLVAEALECLGRAQAEGGGTPVVAEASLEQALVAANEVEDDATAARAWVSLLFVATMRGAFARAEYYELPARAAVAREDDDVLHAWLLNNLGILAAEMGHGDRAREHFENALALKEGALGPDHLDVGIAWQNLGALLSDIGEHRDAVGALEHARAIFAATVGEAHAWNVHVLYNSCRAERGLAHPDAALALCERAVERFAAQTSPLFESRMRFTLAETLWDVGRPAEARAMARRAISLASPENPKLADDWTKWLETHEETRTEEKP